MNKYSFLRPNEAVKAFNAAYSEIRRSDEFSWITELFWGEMAHIDDDSTPEEIAECIESLLYVAPHDYRETYDIDSGICFYDNVKTWSLNFVNKIVIECSGMSTNELFDNAYRKRDQVAINTLLMINNYIIDKAAQYFVYVFCKHYGAHYDDFWNKSVI